MKRPLVTMFIMLLLLVGNLSVLSSSYGVSLAESVLGKPVTIPADTVFRLRLNQGLSSKTAKVGDKFTAEVTGPVVVGDVVAVPVGSTVYGRVTTVTKAARRQNGTIGVSFYTLKLTSGKMYKIYGSLVSLEDEKGREKGVGDEGEVKGKSTTKRNVVFIGGGAGAGAAIGAIAGGGKGAGIGAAIGAGAGVAGALLSKGNEAEVVSGTEVGMALDQAVKVSR